MINQILLCKYFYWISTYIINCLINLLCILTFSFDVEAGRIRQSLIFGTHGLDLFVSGDQLLRGAALNAVLIALKIIELQNNNSNSNIDTTVGTKRPLEDW